MILLNRLEKEVKVGAETFGIVLKLIAPFAPHIADEMWKNIGGKGSIHTAQWPVYDGNKIQSNEVTIAIQVNGKMRGSIVCTRGISQEEVIRLAKQEENVKKWTEGKNIRKEIYVEGKLVSLVID
jgi:leucyl-tRNA synthetase